MSEYQYKDWNHWIRNCGSQYLNKLNKCSEFDCSEIRKKEYIKCITGYDCPKRIVHSENDDDPIPFHPIPNEPALDFYLLLKNKSCISNIEITGGTTCQTVNFTIKYPDNTTDFLYRSFE